MPGRLLLRCEPPALRLVPEATTDCLARAAASNAVASTGSQPSGLRSLVTPFHLAGVTFEPPLHGRSRASNRLRLYLLGTVLSPLRYASHYSAPSYRPPPPPWLAPAAALPSRPASRTPSRCRVATESRRPHDVCLCSVATPFRVAVVAAAPKPFRLRCGCPQPPSCKLAHATLICRVEPPSYAPVSSSGTSHPAAAGRPSLRANTEPSPA